MASSPAAPAVVLDQPGPGVVLHQHRLLGRGSGLHRLVHFEGNMIDAKLVNDIVEGIGTVMFIVACGLGVWAVIDLFTRRRP